MKESISVVIPVYNDEEVLSELLKRLVPVCESITDDYEIIFVDDGSKDKSVNVIIEHKVENPNLKLVKLARNFGQASAIAAGLHQVKNDFIVLMDSDLQDRPEDIPTLLREMLTKDTVMAIALWESRDDSLSKKLASALFYNFSQKVTNIHYERGLGVFRIMRAEAIKPLLTINESTGTVLSLLYWSGLSYTPVPLNRDSRFAGKSGYTLKKSLSLTAQRIFSYSLFPIKMATVSGIILAIISFLCMILLIVNRIFSNSLLPGWTSIIVIQLFLFGILFVFLGVIGEYLGRVYLETKNRPNYVIEKII